MMGLTYLSIALAPEGVLPAAAALMTRKRLIPNVAFWEEFEREREREREKLSNTSSGVKQNCFYFNFVFPLGFW